MSAKPKPPGGKRKTERSRRPASDWLIYAALLAATLAVYAQTRGFSFVNYDDPEYVTGNAHVRAGITPDGVAWAFTSTEAANWFPLTRLSHMLDCQWFGLDSGLHHLTSILLHALAALVLFAFLRRATGARWPSAFAAFIFALHPAHVESAAWISERKDVLSAFLWFLALWGYARYAQQPGRGRYVFVLAAFALGLMAKPMIVTLPVLLVLLDLWPLRRGLAVHEKAPFVALATASAIVTFAVQQRSGAVRTLAVVPFAMRIENALVSYAAYVVKAFWPRRLAVFYPYPHSIPLWQPLAAATALAAITAWVLRERSRRPYLMVGWLWYLVTLAPVIGLVQVGSQARADRYMYVPMVGLLIMLGWGAADVIRSWPQAKVVIAAMGALACCACAPVAWRQAGYWRNSETLFKHALAVTNDNYLAEHNLGSALLDDPARLPEAAAHLQEAVRLAPDSVRARTDLGSALAKMRRFPEAIAQYQAALRLDPGSAITRHNLGSALAEAGRPADAIREYEQALRLDPGYAEARSDLAEAHYRLGLELAKTTGHASEAVAEFETALRVRPDYPEAHNNLGVVLSQILGRQADSLAHFREAVRLEPGYTDARYNLAVALADTGRAAEAMEQVEAGLRVRPDPELEELRVKLSSLSRRMNANPRE